jgi:hypothetical protein
MDELVFDTFAEVYSALMNSEIYPDDEVTCGTARW